MKFFGGLFGNSQKSASFSSATIEEVHKDHQIKINGAEYSAINTKDGFFTLKDVLFFGEVPKGEKSAPEDVKGERMQQMVKTASDKYEKEKFAAPAHKGHHKAIAFEDPEFLGFMLPKRVGKTTLDGREQDAVFGDLKLKASAFERVRKGELPFLSPEVDWDSWQFSSMALLDSMPPHFKGPLITVGKVTEDANAKFTVGATLSMGKFTAIEADKKEESNDESKRSRELKRVKDDEKGDTKVDGGDTENGGHDDAKMCAHCVKKMAAMEASYGSMDKTMADIHYKMGLPYKGAQMQANKATGKADSSAPVEDGHSEKGKDMSNDKKDGASSFESDPVAMAKFAAQEARLKAMEDKLTAKEQEDAKKVRIEAAFAELKGYPLTDAGKNGIAAFADSPEKLKTFIEVLKAQTPKDPPRSVSEFEASAKEVNVKISGADPDIAAFQAKGPEAMEAAIKYAARFEAMKADKACKGSKLVQEGRKAFIEHMMELDPSGDFGRKKVS